MCRASSSRKGCTASVTWVIEQGAVGGVPLLDFAFGCAANAEAIVASPHQFTYFQAGGFDASLLSFLQIGRCGSVNVSKLSARPHVTAGAGGFVDITARARKIVFSGFFNAGAKLAVRDGALAIDKEGKVQEAGARGRAGVLLGPPGSRQGQDVTYVTERCVMKLTAQGVMVTEIAPGADLERDVLAQAGFPLQVAADLKMMPGELFRPEPFGLSLRSRHQMSEAAE